jgi:rubrerythrin
LCDNLPSKYPRIEIVISGSGLNCASACYNIAHGNRVTGNAISESLRIINGSVSDDVWRDPPSPMLIERENMTKLAEDILKTAILLEHRGKAFYTTAARETQSEAVRKFFTRMAEEEDEHIEFLSRQFAEYAKNGRFSKNTLESHAEDTEASMILSEMVKKEISAAGFEAAAISAAIDFENRAIEVYQGRSNNATDPNEKEMYQTLADWERTHFHMLHKIDEDLKEQIWQDNNFWPF